MKNKLCLLNSLTARLFAHVFPDKTWKQALHTSLTLCVGYYWWVIFTSSRLAFKQKLRRWREHN